MESGRTLGMWGEPLEFTPLNRDIAPGQNPRQ